MRGTTKSFRRKIAEEYCGKAKSDNYMLDMFVVSDLAKKFDVSESLIKKAIVENTVTTRKLSNNNFLGY